MLPASARLNAPADFREVVRRGRRRGRPHLVVHLATIEPGDGPEGGGPARVGFVVSKAVGIAVARNRVKRRLRHLAAERHHRLPAGSRLVVRALPLAAEASYSELGADLDAALERLAAGSRA